MAAPAKMQNGFRVRKGGQARDRDFRPAARRAEHPVTLAESASDGQIERSRCHGLLNRSLPIVMGRDRLDTERMRCRYLRWFFSLLE